MEPDRRMPRRKVTVYSLLTSMILVLLLAGNFFPVFATASDDNFGMYYDTAYVPSNTSGIQASYSISTSGISCTSTSGSFAAVESVRTNGGSPDQWWLQGIVGLYCRNYPSASFWQVGTQVFDNNGNLVNACPPTCGNLATLSTSTYPSLSGTISIYYSGSAWILKMYVSQTGQNYEPSTYSSIAGTLVESTSGSNDWTSIESDPNQSGLSYTSALSWDITNPEFLVAGGWETWNTGSSGSCSLDAYVADQPNTPSTNTLAVQKISNDGVNVYYYGANPPSNNGNTISWSIASSYYLTMGVNGGGTVSPSSGNQNCDSSVSITGSPGAGDQFCYWTGSGSGSYTGSNNPASVTMNAAITETAVMKSTCPQFPSG